MSKNKNSTHPIKRLAPIIIVIGIFAITLGLFGYSLVSKAVPIGINEIRNTTRETTLTFSPNSVIQNIDTEAVITLNANAGNLRLTILSVELTYDPDKISTPLVTLDNFLPNVMTPVKVENGKISFTIAAAPASGGVTGTGVIATIKFKPTVAGSSNLSFTDKTLSASLTTDKEYVSGNTLKLATDATITGITPGTDTTNSNDVLVVTNTPKPTVKPRVVAATATPVVDNSSPDSPYDNTYTTTTADTSLIPVSDEPVGTVTNTTVTRPPSFFKKLMIGWGIIIQYILSLFGITK